MARGWNRKRDLPDVLESNRANNTLNISRIFANNLEFIGVRKLIETSGFDLWCGTAQITHIRNLSRPQKHHNVLTKDEYRYELRLSLQ